MKNALLTNFVVDKQSKTIRVEREFQAPLDDVWAAWTQSELLDQWWAPKPWKAVTKALNFIEGGSWLYAMAGPEGEKNWCRSDFHSINDKKSFKSLIAFCDQNGAIDRSFPTWRWENVFQENNSSTTVFITFIFDELNDLEKIVEMGFKEGFASAIENLDQLLARK